MGPCEKRNHVEALSAWPRSMSYVDIDMGVRFLILVGIASDPSGPRFRLHSSPSIRWQGGLYFINESSEQNHSFFFSVNQRTVAGDMNSDTIKVAIHSGNRRIKPVLVRVILTS